MAEKPSKPRRDLRARLGKTITPKTQGGPDAGAAVPTPSVGAAAATAAVEKPAVKAASPLGIAAPPASIGSSPMAGIDVAPPPFARPAARVEPETPGDPFAASAPAVQQQVVRLEFDERMVTDVEVGKTRKMVVAIVGAVALVVGAGVGVAVGQMLSENKLHDAIIRDAQAIYGTVNTASTTIETAQRHVNAIVQAAAGAGGEQASVDFQAIEALRGLERPFDPVQFTNKNYNAFNAAIVGDLFAYMMNVARLWDLFRQLAAQSLASTARPDLEASAARTGAVQQYGVLLQRTDEGGLASSLVVLAELPEGTAPPEGIPAPHVFARANHGGQGRPFGVYNGEQDITTNPQFVLAMEASPLLNQDSPFTRFRLRIVEIKQLVDATVEIQGRLLTAISAAITEAGASVSGS